MKIESAGYPYSTQYIEETAAYVRVSHTEQKLHGLSLEAQTQALAKYAEDHHLKIVEWYRDEGVSARKLIKKRPELQRMIHDAQKGRFKRIIFLKLDRYFRSVSEFHECQKILDEAGVTWTATEEKYDMSTANGRAFVNMKLTIAELEADTAGERVKIVNEYKIREGMPLTGTQSFPFCYAVSEPEPGERHKYIVKRDEEIMEELIAHVMVNHSIRGAMVYINNKFNRSYSYGAVTRALRNTMIYGYYKGNPNYCKPYITKEMFDRLQEIIKKNPRTSPNEHAYFFTGLVKCPVCGRRLSGVLHNRISKGRKYKYYAYRCPKHYQDKQCSFSKSVFEKRLERIMLERLEPLVEEQEIQIKEIKEAGSRVSKYDIEELQAELDRLNYSWKKGRIKNVEDYDRDYDALMAKINAAHDETFELSQTPDIERIKDVLQSGWKEIYNELDDEHKRAFWRSFVEEIQLTWTTEEKDVREIKFF